MHACAVVHLVYNSMSTCHTMASSFPATAITAIRQQCQIQTNLMTAYVNVCT